MSGSCITVRPLVAATVALLLLSGCVDQTLPQEGGDGEVTAGPGPADSPGDPAGDAVASEALTPCEAVLAGGGEPVPTSGADQDGLAEGGDGEDLTDAFEACETFDEFRAAAAEYPSALDGNSPDVFVVDRCESVAAVQDTALCRDVQVDDGGQFSSEDPSDA